MQIVRGMGRSKLTIDRHWRVQAVQVVQQTGAGQPLGNHSDPRGLFRVIGAAFMAQAIGMRNKGNTVHGQILTDRCVCVPANMEIEGLQRRARRTLVEHSA